MSSYNPGNAKFTYKKYYPIRKLIFTKFKERFKSDMLINSAAQVLLHGDTQPALVCSTEPLLVAAYSDAMDAVVMLKFPSELIPMYDLKIGTRLVSSTAYNKAKGEPAADIILGESYTGEFIDFYPIVQLFIAGDDEKIRARTELFSEEEWAKVERLAIEYLSERPDKMRDGFFYFR